MCFQVLDATAVIDGNVVGTLFSMRQSGGFGVKRKSCRNSEWLISRVPDVCLNRVTSRYDVTRVRFLVRV